MSVKIEHLHPTPSSEPRTQPAISTPLPEPPQREDHKRPQIIYAAGLQRSGSTWQFNLLRLLSRIQEPAAYGAWIEDYDPRNPAKIHVVKIHDVAAAPLQAQSVSSYRDIRAVAGSMVRMGWANDDPSELLELCSNYIDQLNVAKARCGYIMRYERMLDARIDVIVEISAYVGIKMSHHTAQLADHLLQCLTPPTTEPVGSDRAYDKVTALHPGHIGGKDNQSAIANLAPSSVEALEAVFGTWLLEHGYA